ncbi:hypothetical protein R1sor_022492 [Riccia sorocarpa]|uniref:Uncharacterized protein n=1 Tax=Riccia sorocarpa TaxID=122646 RepID=A0ABD3GLI9_9MARC
MDDTSSAATHASTSFRNPNVEGMSRDLVGTLKKLENAFAEAGPDPPLDQAPTADILKWMQRSKWVYVDKVQFEAANDRLMILETTARRFANQLKDARKERQIAGRILDLSEELGVCKLQLDCSLVEADRARAESTARQADVAAKQAKVNAAVALAARLRSEVGSVKDIVAETQAELNSAKAALDRLRKERADKGLSQGHKEVNATSTDLAELP